MKFDTGVAVAREQRRISQVMRLVDKAFPADPADPLIAGGVPAITAADGSIVFRVGSEFFRVKGVVTRLLGSSADAAAQALPTGTKEYVRRDVEAPMRTPQERKKVVVKEEASHNIEMGW